MVRKFHYGIQAHVQHNREYSELFQVTDGVVQSCVMAPTLFKLLFSVTPKDAFQDCGAGFPIMYHFGVICKPNLGANKSAR